MPPLTKAAVLLGAGLFAQSASAIVNVACNSAFAPTRPPLSTLLPDNPAFARCIEITGWGDSARFVPSGTGGAGTAVLDAFSLTLRGEGPEVMLFRQRQLTGQPMTGVVALWQVSTTTPVGAIGGVELSEVLVQSVSTSTTVDGHATSILLLPTAATWRAWRSGSPGPGGAPAIIFTRDFANP
jgi:hypothetical protein